MIGWLECLRERNGAAVEMTEGGRRTRGSKQSATEHKVAVLDADTASLVYSRNPRDKV
jgi:hypothetical protein